VANRFVTYLVRKVLERVEQGKGRASRPKGTTDLAHRKMMSEALAGMEAWQQRPTDDLRHALWDLMQRMQVEQNEYKNIPWGAVRLVTDWDLFLFEQALRCLLHPGESGHWAYQMARDYAERYDSSHGTGLTPASAALLQDIADFWTREVGLTEQELATLVRKRQVREQGPPARRADKSGTDSRKKARFTHRQGQFLAFIHLYRKLHRRGPAELDLVQYFRVTPPSVHGMVVKLEQLGLITREPGVPRSVRVALPEEEIPSLENVSGPTW
jgi:DNA-binding MarR family transcriptional regulator